MHEEQISLPPLRIYLFGRQEIWRGAECLPPLATQKTQSLLAYLIFHRQQQHRRQKLADLFWGDCDETHALHSLATALWRIRKQLGEGALFSDSELVQFNPLTPFWLDVAEFEEQLRQAEVDEKSAPDTAIAHLEKAVNLYRGDFLEEFYEDWCLDERYRLESLYLHALRRLITYYEGKENATAVLTYAQSYLAREPLDEEIHLSAMRAYMRQGDTLGARRQWQRCCQTRLAELHLPPSPLMVEQSRNILGVFFTLPEESKPIAIKGHPRPKNLERSPFVGRAAEMEYLTALWEQTLHEQGQMIFLAGEAGIGKTRLIEEFSSIVRWRGGLVVHGHCYELERGLPLQPIREIVQDLLANNLTALQELSEWERKELARLLPQTNPSKTKSESLLIQIQPEQQAILFQAIVALLRYFTKRIPLLMVVEDLHWAADTTLVALHFLGRQIASMPVLIVGTFRQEEMEQFSKTESMLSQLVQSGQAQVLVLERLSKSAVSELAQWMNFADPRPEWVDQLYTYTEGNAFYTLETLRAIREASGSQDAFPIAKNVQALIKQRLGRLSPLARKLIACSAVAGKFFDFDLLRLALEMNEETALEGIDELIHKGFIREGSSATKTDYEFVHQIVQDVTYGEVHHRRRRQLHCKIGEVLENILTDSSLQADSLAFHFDAGGNLQKALHYHHLAAQRAVAVFAWQEAEQHQNRVLQILATLDPAVSHQATADRYAEVLAQRAELYYLQGDLGKRDQDLKALSELATRTQDDRVRLQALMSQTCYLNLDACYEQALAVAQEGIALAQKLADIKTQGYLLSQMGFADYFLGKPSFALQSLEEALNLLPEEDCETRRHITHILGYVHFHLGNYTLALEHQQQAYRDHQKLGDFNGLVWAGLDIGASYLQLGRLDEAERVITEHLVMAQRMGARSAEAYGLNQLGNLRLKQGNYAAAIRVFQQSLTQQQGLRTEHGRIAAQLGIGFANYHLGANSEARKWLETAIDAARRVNHRRRLAEALIGLGLTEVSAGNLEDATLCLTEAAETARDCQCLGNLAAGLAALARLSRRKGELETAFGYACEALQISRQLEIAVCEMWAELEIGLIHLALGDKDTALKHTQRAVERMPYGDDSWIGREQVHQAHARALRALGDEQGAREQEQLANQMIATKATWITDESLRSMFLKSENCAP